MARETVAQRNARMVAEREAELAVAKATYLSRLMSVLERATKVNFELEVRDGVFVVEDRDARRDGTYRLPVEWSQDADNTLDSLEFEVGYKEEAEREAERKAALKSAALSKLSVEEREVLGL
jgi:hypothetical protein